MKRTLFRVMLIVLVKRKNFKGLERCAQKTIIFKAIMQFELWLFVFPHRCPRCYESVTLIQAQNNRINLQFL